MLILDPEPGVKTPTSPLVGWRTIRRRAIMGALVCAIAGNSLTNVVRPEGVNGLPMAMVAEPLSPLFSLDVINHPRTKVHVGRGTACVIIAVRGPAIGTECSNANNATACAVLCVLVSAMRQFASDASNNARLILNCSS